MRLARWTVFAIVGAIALIALTETMQISVVTPTLRKKENRFQKILPQLTKDLHYVWQLKRFKTHRRKNAHSYLREKLIFGKKLGDSRYDQYLGIPASTWKLLLKGNNFTNKKINFAALDLGWMNNLLQFDHWDVWDPQSLKVLTGKLQNADPVRSVGILATFPKYDLIGLHYAARAHLIQALKSGRTELKIAVKIYRNVTQLLFSSHSLVASVIAVNMLTFEKLAKDRYGKQFKWWRPINKRSAKKHKNVFWAMGGFVQVTNTRPIPTNIIAKLHPETGVCAHIVDQSEVAIPMLRFRFGTWNPFRTDYEHIIEANLKRLYQWVPSCGLQGYWQAAIKRPSSNSWVEHIPFFGRSIGLYVVGLANVDYSKFYLEKNGRKTD